MALLVDVSTKLTIRGPSSHKTTTCTSRWTQSITVFFRNTCQSDRWNAIETTNQLYSMIPRIELTYTCISGGRGDMLWRICGICAQIFFVLKNDFFDKELTQQYFSIDQATKNHCGFYLNNIVHLFLNNKKGYLNSYFLSYIFQMNTFISSFA